MQLTAVALALEVLGLRINARKCTSLSISYRGRMRILADVLALIMKKFLKQMISILLDTYVAQ